jgi:alkyl hydroperoxide reductase 1
MSKTYPGPLPLASWRIWALIRTQLFMSDVDLEFSKKIGWYNGARAARYAIIIDHGKIVYAERDTVPKSIEKSGSEAVLAKL